MARVHVERIRPFGGVRAFVSGPRCAMADLDVGRFDADVVTPTQGTVLPVTGFSSDGCFVHDRRQHVSGRPAAEVDAATYQRTGRSTLVRCASGRRSNPR